MPMNNLTFAVSSVPEENCGMACWHTLSQCDPHRVGSFSPIQGPLSYTSNSTELSLYRIWMCTKYEA